MTADVVYELRRDLRHSDLQEELASSRRDCWSWAAWPRNGCESPARDGRTGPRSIEQVINGDEAINRLQIEIDDRCFKLLALHQPMAVDLRAIVAAVKINSDLERIGDLAVNIAEAAERYLSIRR